MSAVTGRVFVAVDLNAESQSRGDFKYQCLAGSALVADKAATPGCNSTFFIFHSTFACRLVRAQELVAPTNRNPYTVTYAYDHRGRMVKKEIRANDGNDTLVKSIAYVWDGWNVIRETVTNPSTLQPFNSSTDYVWGPRPRRCLAGRGRRRRPLGGRKKRLRHYQFCILHSAFCILHCTSPPTMPTATSRSISMKVGRWSPTTTTRPSAKLWSSPATSPRPSPTASAPSPGAP